MEPFPARAACRIMEERESLQRDVCQDGWVGTGRWQGNVGAGHAVLASVESVGAGSRRCLAI